MVFVKLFDHKRLALLVCTILWLYGCGGTTPVPDTITTVAETPKVSLLETLLYIPQPKYDKKGQQLPYQAAENPYLQKRSVSQSVSAQFVLAEQSVQAGDLERAKKMLLDMRQAYPKLSGPLVLLGDIAVKNTDYAEAERLYIEALTVNSENVNAYLRLAKVQRVQGGFAQAQNTYATVLELWPDFPEAHLNLGILYDLYLNDHVKAQRHVEAYQFLTGGENQQVANWLSELQKRTGLSVNLNNLVTQAKNSPVG